MKNLLLCLSFGSLILLFSECKRKGSDPKTQVIEIPYTKVRSVDTIPPLPISIPIDITDSFATLAEATLGSYGFTKEQVTRLEASSMSIIIDNNLEQKLDFVDDSVKILVDAYGGSNPTLVAHKYGIPLGVRQLDFNMTGTDIKDYFNNQYMQVTLRFNTRINEAMRDKTMFIINFKFKITVKVSE